MSEQRGWSKSAIEGAELETRPRFVSRDRGAAASGGMLALQVLYEVDLTDHDPDEAMARAFSEHGR